MKKRLSIKNRVAINARIEYLYAIYFEDPDDIYSLCYAINAKTKAELAEAQKAGKTLQCSAWNIMENNGFGRF